MSRNNLMQSEVSAVVLAQKAIYTILEKKITIGMSVYTLTSGDLYTAGTIDSINLDEGYITLKLPPRRTEYIRINDIIYIEVLCTNDDTIKNSKCKNLRPRPGDATYNIWLNFNIGEAVIVNVAVSGPATSSVLNVETFIAIVQYINLKDRYVGLKTPSGITYVPIDSLLLVEKNL